METTMATALAKAGRKGPQARLHDHAIEALDDALGGGEPDELTDESEHRAQLEELAVMALKQDPQNFQAALGIFLGSLSKDAGALNALIGGDKVRVRAGEYLHEIWLEHFGSKDVKVRAHERGAPGKNGGQRGVETHVLNAAGGGGHSSVETQAGACPRRPLAQSPCGRRGRRRHLRKIHRLRHTPSWRRDEVRRHPDQAARHDRQCHRRRSARSRLAGRTHRAVEVRERKRGRGRSSGAPTGPSIMCSVKSTVGAARMNSAGHEST